MIQRFAAILTVCLAASLAACDDDGGGSATEVNSGLPPEQTLSSVTDDDAEQLCTAVETLVERLVTPNRICTVFAVAAAPNPQACEQFKAECLKMPPDTDDFSMMMMPEAGELTCAEELAEKAKDCDATVAELEACQSDAAKTALAALNLSCSDAPLQMEGEGEESPFMFEEPESCKTLNEKCPGLSDDGPEDETSSGPTPRPDEADAGQ